MTMGKIDSSHAITQLLSVEYKEIGLCPKLPISPRDKLATPKLAEARLWVPVVAKLLVIKHIDTNLEQLGILV